MKKGLMWKLLRQHISKMQLVGFSVANLVGLTIVILAVQFTAMCCLCSTTRRVLSARII